jgi:hypothetical protein
MLAVVGVALRRVLVDVELLLALKGASVETGRRALALCAAVVGGWVWAWARVGVRPVLVVLRVLLVIVHLGVVHLAVARRLVVGCAWTAKNGLVGGRAGIALGLAGSKRPVHGGGEREEDKTFV